MALGFGPNDDLSGSELKGRVYSRENYRGLNRPSALGEVARWAASVCCPLLRAEHHLSLQMRALHPDLTDKRKWSPCFTP